MNIHRSTKRLTGLRRILVLLLILPAVMGGCPDFRNGVIDSVDAATRGLLFGSTALDAALGTAAQGIINAALDLLFAQLRVDTAN